MNNNIENQNTLRAAFLKDMADVLKKHNAIIEISAEYDGDCSVATLSFDIHNKDLGTYTYRNEISSVQQSECEITECEITPEKFLSLAETFK